MGGLMGPEISEEREKRGGLSSLTSLTSRPDRAASPFWPDREKSNDPPGSRRRGRQRKMWREKRGKPPE